LVLMLAHEIMTRRPLTATPQTSLRRARGLLRRGRFRRLPIVRDGQPCGVLSDRDLQRALAAGRSEVADADTAPAKTVARRWLDDQEPPEEAPP
jgi:CBS domain-containing protein